MSNYVTLVNKLLLRLNEVTLDTGGDGFDTVRNVQQLAKNAINDSIRQIAQTGEEWPFLKNTYTQTLTAGTRTYNFPADASSVDWESFYLKKLTSVNNSPKFLPAIDYQNYTQNFRAFDDEGDTGSGITSPNYVYHTYSESFGVTPVPDDAYEIEYVYWSVPTDLNAFSDNCIIPTRFDYVILDGAMMIMMRFRSNEQSAAVHQNNFDSGIRTMRRVLMDQPMALRSTVIQGSSNAR
jgi:hypothetical protein